MAKKLNDLVLFIAASVVYLCFGVYLFWPYFKHFSRADYLIAFNCWLGCLGCCILTRRWVTSFACCFFAGLIYGFGPYMLGLGKFHAAGGLLAAVIPWLFCVSAYFRKDKFHLLRASLSVLPFLTIVIFFQLTAKFGLFAVPTQIKLQLKYLAALLSPIVMADRADVLIGFYHVPITAIIIGSSMLIKAKRYGMLTIIIAGLVLSFVDSFGGVSPVIWLSIPVVCLCVISGAGSSGLISAGFADRKRVLSAAVIMLILSIIALLAATKYFHVIAGLGDNYADLFVLSAKMYLLGAIAMGIVYFMSRANLHYRLVKEILLCSAMAVDIFFSARYIVDKIF